MYLTIIKNNLKKEWMLALFIAVLSYILFFHNVVFDAHTVFWGSDMKHKFHPARVYLYEKIVTEHSFPFWTEKVYSGFPIYADLENAYLHPINIVATVVLRPILAYKLIHFLSYLVGSLGLYFFLKKKNVGLVGYTASNLIFFFSFFFINHQIHQSLILSFYTFPLSLFLVDKYMESKSKLYTFYAVLVLTSAFYWGHPQMFLIYVMGMGMYGLSFYLEKLKTFIKHITVVLWFTTILVLPQLIPSVMLNKYSIRSFDAEEISATQGAFNPLMTGSFVFPIIFLNLTNYQGEDINPDFSFVETYMYFGITSTLLFVLGVIFLKDRKIVRYGIVTLTIFTLLTYSAYIPFFNINKIPIFDLFRYWTRISILMIFYVAMVVGIFIDSIHGRKFSIFKLNYKRILWPIGILILLVVTNWGHSITTRLLQDLYKYITTSYSFREWYVLLISTLAILLFSALLYLKNKSSTIFSILAIILVFAIVIDLTYFSREILDFRTDDIEDLAKIQIPRKYINTRVIVEDGEIENNESLYYAFWWPYGYSQFVDEKYYNFFKDGSIEKMSRPVKNVLYSEDYSFYQKLGVVEISVNGQTEILNTNKLDLLQTNLQGEYIAKKEGNIEMSLSSDKEQNIKTFIKHYPGWQTYVDGKKTKTTEDGLFISFPIEKGQHIVKFKFVPKHLYYGILYMFIGLSLSSTFYFGKKVFTKKR